MTETIIQIMLGISGVISGVCIPIILYVMRENRIERNEQMARLEKQAAHLDECIDGLKSHALSRDEYIAMRAEVQEAMTRMRTAVSQDTNGLHDRIMRLENLYFKVTQ